MNKPRRLLICLSRIGDLVMNIPLQRVLARDAEFHMVTRPFGAKLLEDSGQPHIAGVHTLSHPNRGRRGIGRLLLSGHRRALGNRLAAIGFDEVFVFGEENDLIRNWVRGSLPDAELRVLNGMRPASGAHYSEINRSHLEAIGMLDDRYDPAPLLTVDEARFDEARALLAPYGDSIVGFQIGSQRTHARSVLKRTRPNLKSPPVAMWQELARRLIESNQATTVLVSGAPEEKDLVHNLRAGLREDVASRIHDASNIGLDLLPAALKLHRAFISVDTGPGHIAAAVGCPTLLFFGPSEPERWLPVSRGPLVVAADQTRCPPCLSGSRYRDCTDNICLNQLPMNHVWQKWQELMARTAGGYASTGLPVIVVPPQRLTARVRSSDTPSGAIQAATHEDSPAHDRSDILSTSSRIAGAARASA